MAAPSLVCGAIAATSLAMTIKVPALAASAPCGLTYVITGVRSALLSASTILWV